MDYSKLEAINWGLSIALIVLGGLFVWYIIKNKDTGLRQETTPESTGTKETRQLQLGAYERLALLSERLKLENLISSLYQSSYTAKDMQQVMIQNMRQEYAHNITQQIYVSATIWSAVEKMKEQNIFIVSQLANTLPPEASAMDLNKTILEFLMTNPDATMNKLVTEAVQFEAKKLL
jgi:hypothetical protein